MAQCISLGVVCAAEAPMRLVSALNRPALRLASQPPPTLSRQAKQRLKWFDWHASHGRNVSLTCRYFGISRQTFYRWQRRYNPQRIQTLEDRLSRPHQRRQPTWTLPQRQAVHALREQYPRWGKDKLSSPWGGSAPASGAGSGRTRSASRATTPWPHRATWSRSTPWTSARGPA